MTHDVSLYINGIKELVSAKQTQQAMSQRSALAPSHFTSIGHNSAKCLLCGDTVVVRSKDAKVVAEELSRHSAACGASATCSPRTSPDRTHESKARMAARALWEETRSQRCGEERNPQGDQPLKRRRMELLRNAAQSFSFDLYTAQHIASELDDRHDGSLASVQLRCAESVLKCSLVVPMVSSSWLRRSFEAAEE
jgi:hypothetical protein